MDTRGVFALIFDDERKRILISERQDGKGWNLPGGGTDGQPDIPALEREVEEETTLRVEVIEQVGPLHVFKEDTAVAYYCKVLDGTPQPTKEAKQNVYVSVEDLKSGQFTLVGPTDRLGRTGRMVYDGLSILQEPARSPSQMPEPVEGIFASDDGLYLIEEATGERRTWRRLDPFSPTGYMEPAA